MRTLILPFLAALALQAAPPRLTLRQAVVVWHDGPELQEMAPPRLEGVLGVEGAWPASPTFQVWRCTEAQLPSLEARPAAEALAPARPLPCEVTLVVEGTWRLFGAWIGYAPKAEDRLVVEVWQGNRRIAWTHARVDERMPRHLDR